MLDVLESYVQERGYRYVRMDGGTGISSRQPLVQKYNTVGTSTCRLDQSENVYVV